MALSPQTDMRSANAEAVRAASRKRARKQYDGRPDSERFGRATRSSFFIRLPLVLWAGIKAAAQRTASSARTYRQRLDLLDGKLTILFLNGFLPNTVPLLFGELFATVLYDGVAVDPGLALKMRRSLHRHLRRIRPKITKIVATHAHEEHVGSLNWLSELTGARSSFRDDRSS